MIILIVAAAGTLLVVLVHLVAGWFIANGLHRDALKVGPKPDEPEVRVRDVTSDRIVLEAPGPRQDIGHPGTVGVAWPGGYGRAGDILDVEGSRFVRSFEPVTGSPPVCVGELEDCPAVEIDSFAYPNGPADVGLDYQETTYESPLGAMGAWLVPSDGPAWAIHCHGWTAERREHVRMLPAFHKAGITSLVIDYRNDPGAPLDPSGRYRFGLTEWEDLEAAVSGALEDGAGPIVLNGCSTGGALVMAFLERSPLANSVSALVLDAPNVILVDALRRAMRESRGSWLMHEMGLWIADLRWKINWEATNFVARAADIIQVPTLVFHGTSDHTIPISVSRRLQAAVPHLVELVETPAAGHVMSWNADPARYERYLGNFLDRVVVPQCPPS
ncbi:MAG: alpha/beta hydrolase [Actinomycetota bacterium]